MRVTKRLRSEERGAVMMIVAISLLVLVGMLVLTVDLGRMVAVRREMVRAADAAALAAAQECAFGNGSGAAASAASQIADTNHGGASLASPLIFDSPTACDDPTSGGAKLVTVKLTTSLNMFFAPIFGPGNGSRSVTAQATATWATPGTVPIAVFAALLEDCKAELLLGQTECDIVYDMDLLNQPRWGILDITEGFWGMDVDCKRSANWANTIIGEGGIWPLPTPPPPQWACLDNGDQSSTWPLLPPNTYWFPVVNLDLSKGHVRPGPPGVPCTGADIPNLNLIGKDCEITRAWVTDFVKMKVLAADRGNPPVLTVELVPPRSSIAGMEIRLVD